MLKKRLIGLVVVRDGIAVQSIAFNKYLPIGRPAIAVDYLNQWGIDEIAVIDISATREKRIDFELIRSVSRFCQVPLTYGGGVTSASEMVHAVQSGADKVLINNAFKINPGIIKESAQQLGSQCVVVSIDVIRIENRLAAYDYLTKKLRVESISELALRAQELGAGEIFLNSVDRDGTKNGFDLEAAQLVSSCVKIPITLCGGAGKGSHFAEALSFENISGVAAANYFNYTEHSVTVTKQFLTNENVPPLRHDTYFDYDQFNFSEEGRILKKSDEHLKELLFEYHAPEKI